MLKSHWKTIVGSLIGLAFLVTGYALWHQHRMEQLRATPLKIYKGTVAPEATTEKAPVVDPSAEGDTAPGGHDEAPVEKQETAEVPHTRQEDTLSSRSETLEPPFEQTTIHEIFEDILAEEERAQDALSAEEVRRKELKKRAKEVQKQFTDLVLREGGKIHTATHPPEVMRQAFELMKEIFRIEQELAGEPNKPLNRFTNLLEGTLDALNPNGEMSVFGAQKMADAMEQNGYVEGARRFRLVIQRAIDSGDDMLKPEHLEGLK